MSNGKLTMTLAADIMPHGRCSRKILVLRRNAGWYPSFTSMSGEPDMDPYGKPATNIRSKYEWPVVQVAMVQPYDGYTKSRFVEDKDYDTEITDVIAWCEFPGASKIEFVHPATPNFSREDY